MTGWKEGGRTSTPAVDDATGTIPHALFQQQEDAHGYFLLLPALATVPVPSRAGGRIRMRECVLVPQAGSLTGGQLVGRRFVERSTRDASMMRQGAGLETALSTGTSGLLLALPPATACLSRSVMYMRTVANARRRHGRDDMWLPVHRSASTPPATSRARCTCCPSDAVSWGRTPGNSPRKPAYPDTLAAPASRCTRRRVSPIRWGPSPVRQSS